jgi:16S rRNA (adenine1518-N6/adenine1519-N6)-dimethyltransferase
VHIRLRRPPLIAPEEEQAFFRLVRAGFSQKRKQIQKNLRVLGLSGEAITAALTAAGIDGSRRAETLSLDDWVTLLRWLPR